MSSCPATNYNLIYGNLLHVGAYALDGAPIYTKVDQEGDLDKRVPAEGSDTISWLAREFNTMADSVTGLVHEVRDQRERGTGIFVRRLDAPPGDGETLWAGEAHALGSWSADGRLLAFTAMKEEHDIWLLTRGGPRFSTTTFSILIYYKGFIEHRISQAATISLLMFLMLLGFGLMYFRYVMRGETEVV